MTENDDKPKKPRNSSIYPSASQRRALLTYMIILPFPLALPLSLGRLRFGFDLACCAALPLKGPMMAAASPDMDTVAVQ
jgi:hypothetical protein